MLFRVVVYAPIVGIGGFIRVLNRSNTSMAWIIGLAILCIIGIMLLLFIIAMPKFKKLQELVDKLNLEGIDKVFILHDLYSIDLKEQIKKKVEEKINGKN